MTPNKEADAPHYVLSVARTMGHVHYHDGSGTTFCGSLFTKYDYQRKQAEAMVAALNNHARLTTINDALVKALEKAREELLLVKGDAICEHDVNVCYCSLFAALDAADAALKLAKEGE